MKCEICGKGVKRCCDFCRHIVHTHGMSQKEYFDRFIEPFPHKCPYCNSERKFANFAYLKTCCSESCEYKRRSEFNGWRNTACIEKIKKTKKMKYGSEKYNNRTKAKQTTLEHFGVEIPAKSKKVLQKMQNTNLERFGCKSPLQNVDVKTKQQNTCEMKYGETNIWKTKRFKDEMKAKCLEKYGVEHYTQTAEFAKKTRKKHNYDGISFDSNDEVEVYKFCKEHNLNVKYQPCSFKYVDSFNQSRYYFPDFEIEGKLYEVKGNHLWKDGHIWNPYRNTLSEQKLKEIDARDLAKTECMKANNVTVILSTDIDNLDKFFKL